MNENSSTRKIGTSALLAVVVALAAANVQAQESRKVIANPVPVYPETAKRFRLTGIVKVQIVIAPDGRVKETKIIGGVQFPSIILPRAQPAPVHAAKRNQVTEV